MTDKKETNAPLQKRESKPVEKKVRKEPNFVTRYYKETAGELRKVNWPTRQEAIRLTQIVVAVIFIMAAILGGLDYLYTKLFGLIIG